MNLLRSLFCCCRSSSSDLYTVNKNPPTPPSPKVSTEVKKSTVSALTEGQIPLHADMQSQHDNVTRTHSNSVTLPQRSASVMYSQGVGSLSDQPTFRSMRRHSVLADVKEESFVIPLKQNAQEVATAPAGSLQRAESVKYPSAYSLQRERPFSSSMRTTSGHSRGLTPVNPIDVSEQHLVAYPQQNASVSISGTTTSQLQRAKSTRHPRRFSRPVFQRSVQTSSSMRVPHLKSAPSAFANPIHPSFHNTAAEIQQPRAVSQQEEHSPVAVNYLAVPEMTIEFPAVVFVSEVTMTDQPPVGIHKPKSRFPVTANMSNGNLKRALSVRVPNSSQSSFQRADPQRRTLAHSYSKTMGHQSLNSTYFERPGYKNKQQKNAPLVLYLKQRILEKNKVLSDHVATKIINDELPETKQNYHTINLIIKDVDFSSSNWKNQLQDAVRLFRSNLGTNV